MASAGVKKMYRHYLSIKAEEVRVLEHTLSAIGQNPRPQQLELADIADQVRNFSLNLFNLNLIPFFIFWVLLFC